jgi:hypothetical protein
MFKMYQCIELGLHFKDERGYITIACVVPFLVFCDEIKNLHKFEPVIFLHI